MKRTCRSVIRDAATWLVPVFSIAALIVMLSEPVAAQRSRSGRGAASSKIKVGEFAPDFDLPKLTFKTNAAGKTVGVISEKDTVKLSSFRGKKPVCMIMSSYT